uniref:Uncharacterized protein n=1 Tax=Globisporangium ultimum (strain ATCC 200006 / CBS 805.95 / DAOM BR144) TaxID=431595 RepID=K3WNH0_GLOUD
MVYSTQVASLTAAALAVGAALGYLYGHHCSALSAPSAATNPVNEKVTQTKRKTCPKRLILVRHGQSEGNIDPHLYNRVPDNAMHLTELGFEQAVAAGASIKQIIGDNSVRFIVSPYVRTIETFKGITKAWGKEEAKAIPWSEEPRIREQDFGNFQEPLKIRECKAQRRRFGSFFYRFPSGESPADVYDRISSFLESLHRMFEKTSEENYVLVTHGVAIRVILTRYFKYRISEFEQMENFHNGEFVVLDYDEALGKYKLTKVVANHVEMSDDGEVTIHREEADDIRMYDSECLSPMSQPYPTSPVNHFRRAPPPPSMDGSSTASSAASSPRMDPECSDMKTPRPLPITVSFTGKSDAMATTRTATEETVVASA